MESFIFAGFGDAELFNSRFKWQEGYPDCRVVKTYPVERVPLQVQTPAYKHAPILPAADASHADRI